MTEDVTKENIPFAVYMIFVHVKTHEEDRSLDASFVAPYLADTLFQIEGSDRCVCSSGEDENGNNVDDNNVVDMLIRGLYVQLDDKEDLEDVIQRVTGRVAKAYQEGQEVPKSIQVSVATHFATESSPMFVIPRPSEPKA